MKNKVIHLFPKEDIPVEVYDWFVRLHEGENQPEDYAEFEIWARKNPDLAMYLPEIEKIWQHIGEAKLDVPADMKNIRSHYIEQKRECFNSWRRKKYASTFSMPSHFISGVAAAFLLLTVTLFAVWNIDHAFPSFETVGQQRHFITLSDGTTVQLNALTKIEVDYRKHERIIRLISGEAYFKVAKDPARPFLVMSGEAEVKAIGTSFNVKRVERRHSAITLVEGVIKVSRVNDGQMIGASATLVGKGKQAILFSSEENKRHSLSDTPPNADAQIHLSNVNADEIVSWKDDKLIFSGERLKTAINILNKHSSHQLVLLDDSVGAEAIFGVFIMGDWKSTIRAIESTYPLAAKKISPNKTHLVAAR